MVWWLMMIVGDDPDYRLRDGDADTVKLLRTAQWLHKTLQQRLALAGKLAP
jgi:hypothetical protein